MALTLKQKQFIISLDTKVKKFLCHNDTDEVLLMSPLCNMSNMNAIKKIIDSSLGNENELSAYCEQYTGFCRYMKLLERLAL